MLKIPGTLALMLILAACAGREVGVMRFPAGEVQHVVRLDDTPWQPCPPGLPEGCTMAVLEGDPMGEDLFTVRFRTDREFLLPPHWHPKDERVTVIAGKAAVAFGENATREEATEFGPGDYYVNARHAVHTVWLEAGSIVQITGIGPWKAVRISGTATPPR